MSLGWESVLAWWHEGAETASPVIYCQYHRSALSLSLLQAFSYSKRTNETEGQGVVDTAAVDAGKTAAWHAERSKRLWTQRQLKQAEALSTDRSNQLPGRHRRHRPGPLHPHRMQSQLIPVNPTFPTLFLRDVCRVRSHKPPMRQRIKDSVILAGRHLGRGNPTGHQRMSARHCDPLG